MPTGNVRLFARLLSEALYTIRVREDKTLQVIQDELGYLLLRKGGSVIEHWRKGHLPPRPDDVATLARHLVPRARLEATWLREFLASAAYPDAEVLVQELFPGVSGPLPASTQPGLAPFVAGLPITRPRQFFGRGYEVRRIFDLWSRFPLQNIAVVGSRRSGKTSLINYLRTITTTPQTDLRAGQRSDWLPEADRYRWVLVDFQNARLQNQERLLHYLLTEMELPAPEPCDLACFSEIVGEQLLQPTIILLDEIGAAIASPAFDEYFWWGLRSLGSTQTEGNLAFLLAAHLPPAVLAQEQNRSSPFFNLFGYTCELGPLTELEARELIGSSPQPFREADVEWILAQSQRWPAILQSLCQTRLATLDYPERTASWRDEALRQILPFRHLLDEPEDSTS